MEYTLKLLFLILMNILILKIILYVVDKFAVNFVGVFRELGKTIARLAGKFYFKS